MVVKKNNDAKYFMVKVAPVVQLQFPSEFRLQPLCLITEIELQRASCLEAA